jgi:nicotinamidase-related amidase
VVPHTPRNVGQVEDGDSRSAAHHHAVAATIPPLGDADRPLRGIGELAAECRTAGILVIHTSHVLRPDGSNIGVLGEIAPFVRDEGLINSGTRTAALHEDLVVEPSDFLLEKPRFGAFHGTDLELILRHHGIDTIIISGIDTGVRCDTTAREANARDFRVLFLSDGTACNQNPIEAATRHQQAALELIGALFAQVLTIEEVLQKIAKAAAPQLPSST